MNLEPKKTELSQPVEPKQNEASMVGIHSQKGGLFVLLLAILIPLIALLYPVFNPDNVQFSNDGPYGVISSDVWKLPQTFLGQWNDLNWLGNEDVAAPPNMTNLIRYFLGTLGFARFDAFFATLFAGLCTGLFFRVLGGNWWVCAMGGLAAAFNSNNFSNACWGLGSRPLCFGGVMLALAAIAALNRTNEGSKQGILDSHLGTWIKTALAGVGAGLSIMEGYDLGAILCVYIGVYAAFTSLFCPDKTSSIQGDSKTKAVVIAGVRVLLVAAITALAASYSLSSLQETQVKDVQVFANQNNKEEVLKRWNFSTQWSLPKKETLRVIIPGLMGYRMDSPDGKSYWGSVGESPKYTNGVGIPRFSGSGEYAGIFVILFATWAIAHIRRKTDNPFTDTERRHILFWSIIALISLLLAYGRFAPFYQFVFMTPVFGMFRNPIKYMVPFHISMIVLFGYALIGLCRKYLNSKEQNDEKWGEALARGWKNLNFDSFNKAWSWGILVWIGLSILGLLTFIASKGAITAHMVSTGIEETTAQLCYTSSLCEIIIYIILLSMGLGIMAIILGKTATGKKSLYISYILLGIVMVDFYHANKPWCVFYDHRYRLQKDGVLTALTAKKLTDRISVFPSNTDQASSILNQLYHTEWLQHEFPHYNLHTFECWMEPRAASDKIIYQSNLATNMIRQWQLSSTRYILGLKGYASALNEVFGGRECFKENESFTMVTAEPPRSVLTKTNEDGPFAIMEYLEAVPRLALFNNWQIVDGDEKVLATLNYAQFNPLQTVLISKESIPEGMDVPLSSEKPSQLTPLEYETYSPLKFSLKVENPQSPALLLVNDRYNKKWKAYLDGKQVDIVRCNYIARGVFIPQGNHILEMRFEQNTTFFYLSFLVMVIGMPILILILRRKEQNKA